jgi:hydroxymethylbilane synthase
VRGNVDTRISRVSSGHLEGAIVAAAAVIRLGLEESIAEYLPPGIFLPSAGQGALAIEIRSNDWQMAELIAMINHGPTWFSVMAERAFLRSLGGGCRAPIAALGHVTGGWLKLEGMVAGRHGHVLLRGSDHGSVGEAEQVGIRLARKMWRMGASGLITEARLE